MEFEYYNQLTPQQSIIIDNIGEFALEAINDIGAYYYLIIRTSLGMSSIATCGPLVPGVNILPSGYSTTLYKMPYDEKKLNKTIDAFLNDKYKHINYATLIDIDIAVEQFRSVGEYLKNYSEETF